MTVDQEELPVITPANTKKEMLDAFHQLKDRLARAAREEARPQKAREDRKKGEDVAVADAQTREGIIERVGSLRGDITKALSDIADRLEKERETYHQVRQAVEAKKAELNELHGIDEAAFALAALLEAQKQKREAFDQEAREKKSALEAEIAETRKGWEEEKARHKREAKERDEAEDQRRKREKEEFEYRFAREKEKKEATLADRLEALERDLARKEESFASEAARREKDLALREEAVAGREKRMDDLQAQVDGFPSLLEARVSEAVKRTTETLRLEAAKNEEVLKRTGEGERNVLAARIESLQSVVATQARQVEALSAQVENAYAKVQDIAVQAVAGAPKASFAPQERRNREDRES